MRLVIFGLSVSSSWGNGHATLWRGLIRALARRGWRVTFFERDVPYYAGSRDRRGIEGGELVLYSGWQDLVPHAAAAVAESDAVIITSYCPDAQSARDLAFERGRGVTVFYDLDTPVTLARLRSGGAPDYIGEAGLAGYDLVLSFTGGAALDALEQRLGARRAVALYGHVDPEVHHPAPADPAFLADLSYLGTYAADRQDALETLLVRTAARQPGRRFVIAGAQYPADFPWQPNIHFVRHLAPDQHAAFFGSARLTLNVTRQAMAEMGWCPSGRLFEAAACGAAIATDVWAGLDSFFTPESEIIPVGDTQDVVRALDRPDDELVAIGRRARERVLAEHTAAHRAAQLEAALGEARRGARSGLETAWS